MEWFLESLSPLEVARKDGVSWEWFFMGVVFHGVVSRKRGPHHFIRRVFKH